jgi:hypothetical protein
MEMIPYSKINKGYKYILTCIDVFSRFAYAIPLKTKSASDVLSAMKTFKNKPRHIQTDSGKEFYNSHFKSFLRKNDINHYSVFSQFKASVVERFNRTLREKLVKYFVHAGNKTWINVLPSIMDSYNHSKHRSLNGLRPIDVTIKNEMNIWKSRNSIQKTSAKYKVNDYVRISKITGSPFIKNMHQNWSDEVFKIASIDLKQNPVMYVLKDEENEILEGKFYEQELQVIDTPSEFRIEKILKSKGVGKYKQHYVKWHGYKNPSWILSSNLIK